MTKTQEMGEEPEDPAIQGNGHRPPNFWVLTLGSIGVVYGDIGTSPLYAMREAVLAAMQKDGSITEPMCEKPVETPAPLRAGHGGVLYFGPGECPHRLAPQPQALQGIA